MKTYKIALGVVSAIAIGLLVYQVRKISCEKKLLSISDAGYETAFDILYPQKTKWYKKN